MKETEKFKASLAEELNQLKLRARTLANRMSEEDEDYVWSWDALSRNDESMDHHMNSLADTFKVISQFIEEQKDGTAKEITQHLMQKNNSFSSEQLLWIADLAKSIGQSLLTGWDSIRTFCRRYPKVPGRAVYAGIESYIMGIFMLLIRCPKPESLPTKDPIKGLQGITLCLIYADSFFDDSTIDVEERKSAALKLREDVQGMGNEAIEKDKKKDFPRLEATRTALNLIESAVSRDKDAVAWVTISEIYDSQLRSMSVQEISDNNLQSFSSLAAEKGALTSICYAGVTTASYDSNPLLDPRYLHVMATLGTWAQTLDDLRDLEEDIADNIHTYATASLSMYGSLDSYVLHLLHTTHQTADAVCEYALANPIEENWVNDMIVKFVPALLLSLTLAKASKTKHYLSSTFKDRLNMDQTKTSSMPPSSTQAVWQYMEDLVTDTIVPGWWPHYTDHLMAYMLLVTIPIPVIILLYSTSNFILLVSFANVMPLVVVLLLAIMKKKLSSIGRVLRCYLWQAVYICGLANEKTGMMLYLSEPLTGQPWDVFQPLWKDMTTNKIKQD